MEAVDLKGIRYLYFTLIFGFLLGISDGYIALWKDGNPKPLEVFPYQARSLPIADQQALYFVLIVHSVQTMLVILLGIYSSVALAFTKPRIKKQEE